MTDTFDNRLVRVPIYTSSPEDVPGPEPMVIPPQLVPTEAAPQEPWYSRASNALLDVLDQFGVAGLPEGERREATKEARNKLLHIGPMEEQDYLWPEKMLRSAVTLAGDVRTGNVPPPGLRREDYTDIPVDPGKVGGTPHDDLIQRVQDMAGLAMTGGLAGTGERAGMALGSGPVSVARNFKDIAYPHAKMERGDWARYNRAVENGDHTEVELPLRALNATQKTVNPDFMGVKNDELPAVLKKGGEYYIQDGHHRLMREAENGKQTARVRLYDIDPSTRDPRQLTLLSRNESAAPLAALEHLTTGQLDDAARAVANKPYKELDHAQQQRAQKLALETVHAKNEAAAPLSALERGPVWYSPVEHALEQSTQGSATGAQWLATIRNSRGVKPEELDWTGLRQFLEERADQPVSRPELHEYLRDNRVELQDVTRGGKAVDTDALMDEAWVQADREMNQRFPGMRDSDPVGYDDRVMNRSRQILERLVDNAERSGSTKYHSYQLPGGENYREHLITMPIQGRRIGVRPSEEGPLEAYDTATGRTVRNSRGDDNEMLAWAEAENKKGQPTDPREYKSPHWDEPNIVAHVRSNVREMPGSEGKPLRSLHLEEVQSDWHQQALQKAKKKAEAEGKDWKKLTPEEREGYSMYKDNLSDKEALELKRLRQKIDEGTANGDDATRSAELENKKQAYGGVPNAPWKKTWHELALRRMIRLAAEEGMDRVSWTPGEAQAARYDLSKQISDMKVNRHADGTYSVWINRRPGEIPQRAADSIPAEKLEDYIGKDMARKVVGEMPEKGPASKEYSGLDLKVGGEGMRGFYDKMMVQAAEKLGKEYGVKVREGSVPGREVTRTVDDRYSVTGDKKIYDTRAEAEQAAAQPIWYFDIPPAMRSAALGRGMPLFSGGKMFVPSGVQRSEESE